MSRVEQKKRGTTAFQSPTAVAASDGLLFTKNGERVASLIYEDEGAPPLLYFIGYNDDFGTACEATSVARVFLDVFCKALNRLVFIVE